MPTKIKMKHQTIILFLFCIGILQTSTASNLSNLIDNGVYKSTVKYTNYSTGAYEKYTLNVKVENDRVVQIDFGNGGSLHTGYNNEGYSYEKGYLRKENSYSNTVTTMVAINYGNGNMTFYDIVIE